MAPASAPFLSWAKLSELAELRADISVICRIDAVKYIRYTTRHEREKGGKEVRDLGGEALRRNCVRVVLGLRRMQNERAGGADI